MKELVTKLEVNKFLVSVQKEFYGSEAVFAAAHKFTNKCTVLIDSLDASTIDIYFENKNPEIHQDLKTVAQEFCNEMLEQQVRLTLEKKFRNLREVIVKQAFSPISHLKTEYKNDK